MARREIIQYFDDLDNTALSEEQLHSVRFSVEGTDYILDLSENNAREFQKLVAPYVNAARKVTNPRAHRCAGGVVAPGNDSGKIRQWAQDQGIKVAHRGKISYKIVEAYNEAHS